ncbi:MAG: hypothetical protein GXO07_01285 [Crenarchaeota archaeon]|nr:hypothetical protein [Thermoproteota archaeon]
MGRIDFAELLGNIMKEDNLLLSSDIRERSEEIMEELKRSQTDQLMLRDAINSILKDAFSVLIKYLRDNDAKRFEPIIKVEEPNVEISLSSLGMPKEDFPKPLKIFVYAMLDLSDMCWVSRPTLLNVEDKEWQARAFRCIKFTGSSYVMVHSLYDIYFDEGQSIRTVYEMALLRIPKFVDFYNALLLTLSRGERGEVLDVLRTVDELLNAIHSAEKIIGEKEPFIGAISDHSYFQ